MDPGISWGDYTIDNSLVELEDGYSCLKELNKDEIIQDVDLLLMLPPPYRSNWMIKKVAEVKRRLGYAFKDMEQRVENFFWEIERRRSWSPKRKCRKKASGRRSRELTNLQSGVNYDREKGGRVRRKRRRGVRHVQSDYYDEGEHLFLEY